MDMTSSRIGDASPRATQPAPFTDPEQAHGIDMPDHAAESVKRLQQERQAEFEVRTAMRVNEDNLAMQRDIQNTEMLEKKEELKRQNMRAVETALDVGEGSIAEVSQQDRRNGFTMMTFLAMIVGCELDLLGFIGAFAVYWAMDIQMIRILLVVMPAANILCIVLYLFVVQTEDLRAYEVEQDRIAKQQPTLSTKMNSNERIAAMTFGTCNMQAARTPAPAPVGDEEITKRAARTSMRSPVQLQWYHFFPLVRFIMVIKSVNANDVEGLFRVNSLSSFTFGTAQLMSMSFQFGMVSHISEVSLFVWLNVVSQLINWGITIAYFTTPISRRMAAAIAMDALQYNLVQQARQDLLKLNEAIKVDAENHGQHAPGSDACLTPSTNSTYMQCSELGRYRKALEHEIQTHTMSSVDCSKFRAIDLIRIRQVLMRKLAKEYSTL